MKIVRTMILIFSAMLISSVCLAEPVAKKCETYPVKPMKPLYYGQVLLDRLEYVIEKDNRKNIDYELTGWYGGDHRRVWLEAEGVHETRSGDGEVERLDVMYGRLISPFWNARIGVGYKGLYGENSEDRVFGVIGLKGLAPYMFEVDTNLRVSNEGEVLIDFEAEYDVLLTQRLVLQPRLDSMVSFNEIEEMGVGTGINSVDIGFRLRYEIRREFAPYVGVTWHKKFAGTASIADREGEPTESTDIFVGFRVWF